ncbi:hypothetical protein JTE90_028641 [Oedothorax gibbosus]|uniref:Gustatory receptor n=1 Tax=Oedothorax gibbosus TaxID=931172 RepID=A0AAV6UZ94_9ARAC|nr:hypothetical protein JTE90_028641 [Oedothorax gibbosus]
MVFERTVEFKDDLFVENDLKTLHNEEDLRNSKLHLSQDLQVSEIDLMEYKNNAFHFIYKATLALAIPIQPINFRSSRKVEITKWFCLVFFVFKTVTISLALTHIYKMLPDWSSRIAYYIFNFFSYFSMITLLSKRQQIYSAFQTVLNLSARLSPEKFVGSKFIKFELLTWVLSTFSLMVIFILFFFYQEWNDYFKALHLPILGYYKNSTTYTWIIVFGVVSSHTTSFAMCALSVILVYNAFLAAGGVVDSYCKMIQRQKLYESGPKAITRNLILFREISSSVKSVDDAVNECSFFILGTVISSFFATIAVMFSASPSFQTLVARMYVGLTLVGGLGIFFIMTISGNLVLANSENLKSAIMDMSEEIAKSTADESTMRLFILLSDNIRNSDMGLTAADMFIIDKGLILTVFGMVTTYSFLLFQINS